MWQKVSEYAKEKNISVTRVYQKIHDNKLKTKKEKGCILVADLVDEQTIEQQQKQQAISYDDELKRKIQLENDLKNQKLKNIRFDIQLKKQKHKQIVEQQRRQFAQGVFECFTDAFAQIKNILVQMKLNKQQTNNIRDGFNSCLLKFKSKLIQYLRQKDVDDEKGENQNE